ncbi:Peptide (Allatostatin/somatostatin) receptor [Fasciolopsis buskii]|uniref:Peptide (Allatostatin/somatostatin) receptor n=1 Tax=Fasciolopsis buskii TaxID=27845 RepID=A0A8E0S976_9TREM|nr:Peptide (Allatostatin/somatostatin) receptor [Fasciolopsis buski]
MTCTTRLRNLTKEAVMVNEFRAYFTPVLAFFGIVGNILVIITFVHMQHKQKSRFNLYLIFISVAQTTDLIVNAILDDFLGRGLTWASDCTIYIKLDTYSTWSCKLFSYAPKVTSFIANQLLVMSTIDRLMTTYQPIRFRGNSHIRTATVLISLTFVFGMTLFIPQLLFNNVVHEETANLIGKTTCQFPNSLKWGVQFVLYVSTIGTYIVPTMCITVINTLILIKLQSLSNSRYRMCVTSRQSPNEMRRIIGHLILTCVFLFFTFPLTVVIILRQRSDFGGYKILYPEYAQQLVDLSRLFSSFDAIVYSSQFSILFAFLPNFRRTLCRRVCCFRYLCGAKFDSPQPDMTLRVRRESERPGPPIMANFMKVMATGTSVRTTGIM